MTRGRVLAAVAERVDRKAHGFDRPRTAGGPLTRVSSLSRPGWSAARPRPGGGGGAV